MAGAVLRGALLRGVPVSRPAGLQDVGRGDGVRGPAGGVARRGATGHRQGERHRRPSCRHRLSHRLPREGVPDGAGRRLERRHHPRPFPGRGRPLMPGAPKHHTLTVLVENKAGVLTRVAGLFARRGFNIYSLAVAPTDDERFSRITIVVDVESAPLEQVTKQLFKLIPVVKISELDPSDSVERELVLATVRAEADNRSQVIELVQVFEGRIVDVGYD